MILWRKSLFYVMPLKVSLLVNKFLKETLPFLDSYSKFELRQWGDGEQIKCQSF